MRERLSQVTNGLCNMDVYCDSPRLVKVSVIWREMGSPKLATICVIWMDISFPQLLTLNVILTDVGSSRLVWVLLGIYDEMVEIVTDTRQYIGL